MAEPTPNVLARIEVKIDKLGDQISDLATRVTRLETTESSKSGETDRRFNSIEDKLKQLAANHDETVSTLAEAKGGLGVLKWLLAAALGLGGTGTAVGLKTYLSQPDPMPASSAPATFDGGDLP